MLAQLLLLAIGVTGLALTATFNPVWSLAFTGLALLYGSSGVYVASRRLYYLVAVAPHSSLMAIGLTPLAALAAPWIPGEVLTGLLGFLPIALALALISRGAPEALVASWLTALTASLGVLSVALSASLGLEAPLAEALAGDPLLITAREALAIAGIGLAATLLTARFYWVYAYSGADPEDYALAGYKYSGLVEAAGVLMVVASTAGMVWYTGFVVQHVLLLIPPLIAVRAARSVREAMVTVYSASIASAGAGLASSIALNLPPSGTMGMAAALIYIALALAYRGRLEGSQEAYIH